jgi:hypothetical protein
LAPQRTHEGDERHHVCRSDRDQEQQRQCSADHRCVRPDRLDQRGECRGRDGDGKSQGEHDGRVTERKEHSERHRAAAALHHLAGRIVDRRDMVRIDRVAQAEAIGQHGGADQGRMAVEGNPYPQPDECVRRRQQNHHRDDSGAHGKRIRQRREMGGIRQGRLSRVHPVERSNVLPV